MARVQKDTVDYFPHDAGASKGDTLTVLQGQFGNDGYAFWFKLLEKLASTDGHYFDTNDKKKWQLFLANVRVNDISSVEMLNLLVEMGAIDKELWQQDKIIWSQHLVDNLSGVYANRKRDCPAKPQANTHEPQAETTEENPLTTADNPLTTPENTQSKVKYSKEKYIETADRDDLYKILEGTKGFPKFNQENLWKLEDVIKDYPGLNYFLEFKKFKEYWNTRVLKRPWLALRNWLGKAKEKDGKAKGRGLPKAYTESPNADI